MLIKYVNENFIMELKDNMMYCGSVIPIEILKHLCDEYAPQDVDFLEKILKEFEELLDLTEPIDTYFGCQRLLADSEHPIEERTKVVKPRSTWARIQGET